MRMTRCLEEDVNLWGTDLISVFFHSFIMTMINFIFQMYLFKERKCYIYFFSI